MRIKLSGVLIAIIAGTSFAAAPSFGAGKHSGGHGQAGHHKFNFGKPGKKKNISRTVKVEMTDHAFSPTSLKVKSGETIKFVIVNKGEFVHEFNIGRPEMHAAHRKEMMGMMDKEVMTASKINHAKMTEMGMKHDDPNSVLLEPGQTAEIIWNFKAAKNIEFACNVPGHYESGMKGPISF